MWCAQCLEHDIAVQSDDIAGLGVALRQALTDRLQVSRDLDVEPFASLPPASARYFMMYDAADPADARARGAEALGAVNGGEALVVHPEVRRARDACRPGIAVA